MLDHALTVHVVYVATDWPTYLSSEVFTWDNLYPCFVVAILTFRKLRLGCHSQLATWESSLIGARAVSPSLTGVALNSAACFIVLILFCLRDSSSSLCCHSTPKSHISFSGGAARSGSGVLSLNPCWGDSRPNERTHCPTDASDTRTSQEPPS